MLTHVLTLIPRAGAFETMPTLSSVNCEKMNQFCLRDTYTVNKWPDIFSLRLGCYRDPQLVTRVSFSLLFYWRKKFSMSYTVPSLIRFFPKTSKLLT